MAAFGMFAVPVSNRDEVEKVESEVFSVDEIL